MKLFFALFNIFLQKLDKWIFSLYICPIVYTVFFLFHLLLLLQIFRRSLSFTQSVAIIVGDAVNKEYLIIFNIAYIITNNL